MRTIRAAFLAGLLAASPGIQAVAGCQPVATLATDDGTDGAAHVQATIGGNARRFILDTGAPISVIRESIAEELRLERKPIPLDAMQGAAGRPFEERTLVDEMELGGLKLKQVDFLVQPFTHAADPSAAGLIGAEIFAPYDLELDFVAHRIAFLVPGSCRPSGMKSVAVTLLPGDHVVVPVTLDGVEIEALLDTGASRSLMTLDAAHRLFGLDPARSGARPAGQIVAADGGTVNAFIHRFGALTVGPATLADAAVLLMADETHRVHRPLTDGAGMTNLQRGVGLPDFILGMSQLWRLHMIVAYHEHRLYIAESKP